MKNKESLKKKITRLYFSVKGFFIEKKMKNGMYYTTEQIPNSRFMYVGNRMFYKAFAVSPAPGVVYTDQKKVTYKFWEIGILGFK